MNVIFTAIFFLSLIFITVTAPDKLLTSLLGGAERSLSTALTLFCIYAVWMGLSRLAEKSGLSKGAARALTPLSKKLFKTDNPAAVENLAMNLSCNLLGIGGAATPYAVKAIDELEKDKNDRAQMLLFVINATSIQLIPSTVIALRAGAGSAAAFDIFLPSLICTIFSTAVATLLFLLLYKKRGK
ncbi:MAG: nucleoside recognition protein [Clostridia bacterium]|nr:nucleoside recognition protein [Clostridia bacterium]